MQTSYEEHFYASLKNLIFSQILDFYLLWKTLRGVKGVKGVCAHFFLNTPWKRAYLGIPWAKKIKNSLWATLKIIFQSFGRFSKNFLSKILRISKFFSMALWGTWLVILGRWKHCPSSMHVSRRIFFRFWPPMGAKNDDIHISPWGGRGTKIFWLWIGVGYGVRKH